MQWFHSLSVRSTRQLTNFNLYSQLTNDLLMFNKFNNKLNNGETNRSMTNQQIHPSNHLPPLFTDTIHSSDCPSVHSSIHLFIQLSIHLSIHLSNHPSIYPSIHPSFNQLTIQTHYQSINQSIHWSVTSYFRTSCQWTLYGDQ